MSKAKVAKNNGTAWQEIWHKYQQLHPGPFAPMALVEWAIDQGLADLPKVNPKTILVRDVKRAARDIKIRDPQNRIVREMLPAPVPHFDEEGQMYLKVVYDHIHSMSVDHALLVFDRRENNIKKQQSAADRDLGSFLDNNANAKGHEGQFVFDFMGCNANQPPQPVEKISEKPVKKKPR